MTCEADCDVAWFMMLGSLAEPFNVIASWSESMLSLHEEEPYALW